jgi:hypothetical protein
MTLQTPPRRHSCMSHRPTTIGADSPRFACEQFPTMFRKKPVCKYELRTRLQISYRLDKSYRNAQDEQEKNNSPQGKTRRRRSSSPASSKKRGHISKRRSPRFPQRAHAAKCPSGCFVSFCRLEIFCLIPTFLQDGGCLREMIYKSFRALLDSRIKTTPTSCEAPLPRARGHCGFKRGECRARKSPNKIGHRCFKKGTTCHCRKTLGASLV